MAKALCSHLVLHADHDLDEDVVSRFGLARNIQLLHAQADLAGRSLTQKTTHRVKACKGTNEAWSCQLHGYICRNVLLFVRSSCMLQHAAVDHRLVRIWQQAQSARRTRVCDGVELAAVLDDLHCRLQRARQAWRAMKAVDASQHSQVEGSQDGAVWPARQRQARMARKAYLLGADEASHRGCPPSRGLQCGGGVGTRTIPIVRHACSSRQKCRRLGRRGPGLRIVSCMGVSRNEEAERGHWKAEAYLLRLAAGHAGCRAGRGRRLGSQCNWLPRQQVEL